MHKVDNRQRALEAAGVEFINGEAMTDEAHQGVMPRGAKTKMKM